MVLMDREPLALVCAALSAAASGIPLETAEGGRPRSSTSSGNGSGSGGNSGRSGSASSGGGVDESTAQPQWLPSQQQDAAMHRASHDAEAGGSSGSARGRADAQGSDESERPSLLTAWPSSVPALGQAAAVLLQHMQRRDLLPPSGR